MKYLIKKLSELILAASKHQGTQALAVWCSDKMRKEIKDMTEKLHAFFVRIMNGLPGQPIHVQAQWRANLVRFLHA